METLEETLIDKFYMKKKLTETFKDTFVETLVTNS